MELQWYHGREVTEQERKAITEALGDSMMKTFNDG